MKSLRPAKRGSSQRSKGFSSALSLFRQGQLAEAEARLHKLLETAPADFDVIHLLGIIHAQTQRYLEALGYFDFALRLQPQHAEALKNKNIAFRQYIQKQLGAAITWYNRSEMNQAAALCEEVLKVDPDHYDAIKLIGTIAARGKDLSRALEYFDRALAIKADDAVAWNNRGVTLKELKRLEEALASYARALELKPEFAEAHYNRGNALQELKRLEEALASYARALELKPDYAEAWHNRGITLKELKRLEEALASYTRALELKPDYAEAHRNEGLCRLLVGDFEQGWQKYEWRWQCEDRQENMRSYLEPRWHGYENIRGKTILLYAEQGFGDTLQFCRYAQQVASLGASVILEVQAPLVSLLSHLDSITGVIAKGSKLPAFDFHAPLISLPLVFQTRLKDISGEPYLKVPLDKLSLWHTRLGERQRPRIGLTWSGRPTHKNDANRSIGLQDFKQLLTEDFEYYSLQKDIRPGDMEVLQKLPALRSFAPELNDFSDTAALVSLMDLVITVDTSLAHLAGALGKDVWILLPYVPDWRWLLERTDSPWYDSATLFRQSSRRDWGEVMTLVTQQLYERFAGPTAIT